MLLAPSAVLKLREAVSRQRRNKEQSDLREEEEEERMMKMHSS
jgi:hypothetical protein